MIARLLALLALTATSALFGCARMATLSVTQVAPELRHPLVRIILGDEYDSVTISSARTYRIAAIRAPHDTVTFFSISPMVVHRGRAGLLLVDRGWHILETSLEAVQVSPQEAGGYARIDGRSYRGELTVRPAGEDKLAVINRLGMESYLFGVVPGEIGFVDPGTVAAIEAQAVAARTYAFSHLRQYGNKDFDLRADILDQVYGGIRAERPLVTQAVWSTRGRVLRHDGEFARAYYHSTCGGRTESIDAVWDQPPRPYLAGADDDEFCAWSSYWDWTETCTREWLDSNMAAFVEKEKLGTRKLTGRLVNLDVTRRLPSGRVDELVVIFEHARLTLRGDRSRWALGRPSRNGPILPSADYELEYDRDGPGWTTITVRGHGYGHGIGMCQCGAIGRSRAGQTYEEILSAYYRGATLKKMY